MADLADSIASAVTVPVAFAAMKDSDDSIAEIDAMIPRLLKMKKQLLAQKEYIEVAVKLASDGKYVGSNGKQSTGGTDYLRANQLPVGGGAPGKIVDYRVKLYKHRDMIALPNKHDNDSATLQDWFMKDAVAASGSGDSQITAIIPTTTTTIEGGVAISVVNGGARPPGRIFKSGQFIDTTKKLTGDSLSGTAAVDYASNGVGSKSAGAEGLGSDPELRAVGDSQPHLFNGVDLQCTKRFLIGVNSILTQPTNISEIGNSSDFKDAINGGDVVPGSAAKPDMHADYVAGGKHIISSGTLRGLLMQGSCDTAAADVVTDTTAALGTASGAAAAAALKKIRGFGL